MSKRSIGSRSIFRYKAVVIALISLVLSPVCTPMTSAVINNNNGGFDQVNQGAIAAEEGDIDMTNPSPVAIISGPSTANVNDVITFDGSDSYDPQGSLVPGLVSPIDIGQQNGALYMYQSPDGGLIQYDLLNTPEVDDTKEDSLVSPSNTNPSALKGNNDPPVTSSGGPISPSGITSDGNGAYVNSGKQDPLEPSTQGDVTTQPGGSTIPQSSSQPDAQTAPEDGDGGNGIECYQWNFGDNGEWTGWLTTATIEHSYTTGGIYVVTLEVMDEGGGTGVAQMSITIGGDEDTEPPSKVTWITVTTKDKKLDLAWNAATDNIAVAYYEIYRDGSLLQNTPTTIYTDSGLINDQSYTYQVRAVDTSGNIGEFSDQKNGVPAASTLLFADASAGEPYFGFVNEKILFDGTNSLGSITTYMWDFGDGSIGYGSQVKHAYSHVGSYIVTLTVSDDNDASNSTKVTVLIVKSNVPPVANAGGPYVGHTNESVAFNGSKSYDPDGTIVSYLWDFGDGANGTGKCPVHIYRENGTYTVKLTVIDNASGTNTNTTFAFITQQNRSLSKPEVHATVSQNNNHEYVITAVATYPDSDKKMIQYVFDCGDGTNPTTTPPLPSGTVVTKLYTWHSPGTYILKVFVKSETGETSESAELTITIPDNEALAGSGTGSESGSQMSGIIGLLDGEQLRFFYGAIALLTALGIATIIAFYYKKKKVESTNLAGKEPV